MDTDYLQLKRTSGSFKNPSNITKYIYIKPSFIKYIIINIKNDLYTLILKHSFCQLRAFDVISTPRMNKNFLMGENDKNKVCLYDI